MCHNCKNYGPHGEICQTCNHINFYYGNELDDNETLQLLARAMAHIIVKEPEYTVAQSYVKSLIHHHIHDG